MHYLTIPSPVGTLCITSNGEALTHLDWVSKKQSSQANNPDAICRAAANELKLYFAGRLKKFTVPVAPMGTSFQHAVWRIMQNIPSGKTKTYGEVAALLKSAARAVGSACGKNPIPIIIPCHRILGAGNTLGGYSGAGGVQTKKFLLGLEKTIANQ